MAVNTSACGSGSADSRSRSAPSGISGGWAVRNRPAWNSISDFVDDLPGYVNEARTSDALQGIDKNSDAFLKLDPANPAHKDIMSLQRASKFVPTKVSNYDGIESAAKAAGLIK